VAGQGEEDNEEERKEAIGEELAIACMWAVHHSLILEDIYN